MFNTPPVFVNTSVAFRIKNPGTVGASSPPVLAQIQNSSGWLLSVNGLRGTIAIQPFECASLDVTEAVDLLVTPTLLIYPNTSNGYVTSSWMLKGELPPQPDGPLTAGAIIASTQTNSIAFTQSPFTFPTVPGSTEIFTLPIGTPPINSVLFGYSATFGNAVVINDIHGVDSNIQYYANDSSGELEFLSPSNYIVFPFSSILDPDGLSIKLTYLGAAPTPGSFVVLGLTASSERANSNEKAQKHIGSSNINNAQLAPGGSTGQVIRIWSAAITASNEAAHPANRAAIQVNGFNILEVGIPGSVAGQNGVVGSNSLTFQDGLTMATGGGGAILTFLTVYATGQLVYSFDVT